MNWDAIGAIGEIVGAAAVVLTLAILIVQVRFSTRAMEEANRLEKIAAIDRHADTIARWRARLIEHSELSEIWIKAYRDAPLDEIETVRALWLWVEFVNTQRSNFIRAQRVGEQGLATQAVMSVANLAIASNVFRVLWDDIRVWTSLASAEFTQAVDAEMERMEREGIGDYRSFPLLDRRQPDGRFI